jgi:hypothetical protein
MINKQYLERTDHNLADQRSTLATTARIDVMQFIQAFIFVAVCYCSGLLVYDWNIRHAAPLPCLCLAILIVGIARNQLSKTTGGRAFLQKWSITEQVEYD